MPRTCFVLVGLKNAGPKHSQGVFIEVIVQLADDGSVSQLKNQGLVKLLLLE